MALNNFGSTLAKVAVLAGGAIVGAFLARWLDRLVLDQVPEKPDYDKDRYAQGLTPVAPQPQLPVQPLPPAEEEYQA